MLSIVWHSTRDAAERKTERETVEYWKIMATMCNDDFVVAADAKSQSS